MFVYSETMRTERMQFHRENDSYYLYIITDEKESIVDFYIQKVGYGDMYHCAGVPKETKREVLNETNVDNWIDICERNINEDDF